MGLSSNTNQVYVYSMNSSTSRIISAQGFAQVYIFFLLLNLQIIKASTTAREGTTTSSLRGLRHRRPRLQLISPSSPPQAPRAPPLVVWTTPCRATTPQAKCSATRTSCPTTRGTLRVQNPASLGPCTASPRRCLVLARPLPHCL